MKGLAHEIWVWDRALFRVVFRLKWGPLTALMRAFTVVGAAGFLWGVLAAGAFVATGMSPLRLILPWGAVALSWTLSEVTKHLVDRARPHLYYSELAPLIKTPSSSSFPSGHSAAAAAGAITLSAIYPQFAPVLALCGFLVCLSRVYLGVHYPFDVLAGVMIGTLVAALFLVAGVIVA